MRVFFSNRIYKKDLDKNILNELNKLFEDYSSCKHYAYSIVLNNARYLSNLPNKEKDALLYSKVTERFKQMTPYARNTAIQDAKGIHKSRMALLKEQKDILHQRLSNTNKKLEDTKSYLTKLFKIKEMLIKNNLVFDNRQQTFKKTPSGCIKMYRGKGKNKRCIYKFNNNYLFECFIDKEISHVKTRIGLITFKVDKYQDKLNLLENKGYQTKYIPAVQFGTKHLRKQGLTDGLKQQEYRQRRNCRFSVSGRNDSVDGNFVFNYDTDNHSLKIKTGYKKECIVIDNVVFRYGQDIINHYYEIQRTVAKGNGKGKPITYTIEDKGLYYIIKCSLEEELPLLNYSKANGVYGIDFNLGFYSVCETDNEGNPLLMKNIHYEWFKLSTNQIKYNIEQCIKEIVNLAKATNEPIVIEDLKFKGTTKVKDYNSNNSKNFKSHMFAYTKMRNQLIASAKRNGIEVYLVNPMYTSLIGKEKYMPYYKRSIHQMAALAIARRAMYPNRTESIPNRYNNCSSWKEVYKMANK